jgi:predicted Zn-dependent protease with MMP-like domain
LIADATSDVISVARIPRRRPARDVHTILYPMPHHVTKAEFARLVEQALADLPREFADFLDEVPIEIRTRPTRKQLRSVGLADDELLLGLYSGTALPDRSVDAGVRLPDVIYLFQEDIELSVDSADELVREVRITVLHEVGHHFGLDEDELERLGYG